MTLSHIEIEHVAALKENSGYKILLDCIEEQIAEVEVDLESARSDFEQKNCLALWKALRRVLHTLKSVPENFAEAIAETKTKERDEMAEYDAQRWQEAMRWLHEEQRAHLDLLNSQNEDDE